MSVDQLKVTSHVGRDLLQSAALFKHEHSVVWEYVSNGLEYTESGVNPVVKVIVDTKNSNIGQRPRHVVFGLASIFQDAW